MAIDIKVATRIFKFNGVTLPDPGSDFSTDEVKEVYQDQYPDIVSAITGRPEVGEDGQVTITFVRNVGGKG